MGLFLYAMWLGLNRNRWWPMGIIATVWVVAMAAYSLWDGKERQSTQRQRIETLSALPSSGTDLLQRAHGGQFWPPSSRQALIATAGSVLTTQANTSASGRGGWILITRIRVFRGIQEAGRYITLPVEFCGTFLPEYSQQRRHAKTDRLFYQRNRSLRSLF